MTAVRCEQAGLFEKAERLYTELIEKKIEVGRASNNLGKLMLREKRYEASLTLLSKATELCPQSGEFWRSYIEALLRGGQISKSVTEIARAQRLGLPANNAASLNLLVQRVELGDTSKIGKRTDELIPLYMAGQIDQVIALGLLIEKDGLEDFMSAQLLAICFQRKKRFADAYDHYYKSIQFNGRFAETFNNLGSLHREMNRLELAKESYEKAIAFKSSLHEAYNNLGVVNRALGEYVEAKKNFRSAINLKPNYAVAHFNLGFCLAKEERSFEAIESFYHSLKLDPSSEETRLCLGKSLSAIGKYEEARLSLGKIKGQKSREARAIEVETFLLEGDSAALASKLISEKARDRKNIDIAAISSLHGSITNEQDIYDFCGNPLDLLKVCKIERSLRSPLKKFLSEVKSEGDKQAGTLKAVNGITYNGFQTHDNLFKENSQIFAELEAILKKEIERYFSEFERMKCSFIADRPKDLSLNGWYIRLNKGGFQDYHIHPAGWLSGVFYLEVIDDPWDYEGAIEFSLYGKYKPARPRKSNIVIYSPKVGDLLLFPSSLYHRTFPVKQNQDRRVIAFDLVPSLPSKHGS